MTNIYGTIGYTFLQLSEENNNTFILILSDVHSKLKYCDDFIEISDWFERNIDNVNILLEEVSREDFNLGELWKSSNHTIKLKNLFLNNQKKIFDIDIRPYLIPFSWEILNDNTNFGNIQFKTYLELLNDFLNIKHKKIKKKISNIYNKSFLLNHKLKIHLKEIENSFDNFVYNNRSLMNETIYYVFIKNKNILIDLNLILDSCMEWYCISKIYDIQFYDDNKKGFIIHTGLFHSERIISILQKLYNYNIIINDGINNINDAEENTYNGCILLPNIVSEKIINYDKIL
jgi:hypothetical protein